MCNLSRAQWPFPCLPIHFKAFWAQRWCLRHRNSSASFLQYDNFLESPQSHPVSSSATPATSFATRHPRAPMDQLNHPATLFVSFASSHELTRTSPAAMVQVPLASSAALSAGLYQLALGDPQPVPAAFLPPPPIGIRDSLETPRDGVPSGSFPSIPIDHSGWSLARSPVRPFAHPSTFEQVPPERYPNFTASSDRPVHPGPHVFPVLVFRLLILQLAVTREPLRALVWLPSWNSGWTVCAMRSASSSSLSRGRKSGRIASTLCTIRRHKTRKLAFSISPCANMRQCWRSPATMPTDSKNASWS